MVFTIRALNAKQVATRFERMGVAAVSAKPAMESVADMMMRILVKIFESQGRRGGGSWKRDTNAWLLRKQRNNLDPRINFATGNLFRAMTVRDNEHQLLHVTDTDVNLSTDLPYAGRVNRERPFIKFRPADKSALRTVVRDYLLAAWKAPVT